MSTFSSLEKTSIQSCQRHFFVVTTLLLWVMPFHAHGFNAAATTTRTTPKQHQPQRRSHHHHHNHHCPTASTSFIGGSSSSSSTAAFYKKRCSNTHDDSSSYSYSSKRARTAASKKKISSAWPLGVFSQRQGEGPSSFPWSRSKNHTEMMQSSPAYTRRSRSMGASTGAAEAASATTTRGTATSSSTEHKVVHDLLRQHYEYTSDFVSLRHDMIKDAAAAAAAAVAMTPSYHADGDSMTTTTTPAAVTVQQQQEQAIVWARLLLIGAAALYGTNFSLVKLLMGLSETDIPVGLSTALRFGLAALVTSPWLFILPQQKAALTYDNNNEVDEERAAALDATWLGLQVGMCNSIGYVAQAVGLAGTTEAGKSAFICSLAVVVVPFLDWITGRALSQREWMGAALALAGVALLELGDGMFGIGGNADVAAAAAISGAGGIGMDDWISLLQPLAFGMGFFLMEKAMRKYPQHASRSTAAQLMAVFIASTLYCAVMESDTFFSATFWMETASTWLHDPNTLLFLFWTGCISTALSIYMETVALKTLSAAETTLILSTEPIWGAAFATMIIGEQFGINSAIGGLLIMTGCLYSSLGVKGFESFMSNIIPQQHQLQERKQDYDDDKTNIQKISSFQPIAAKMHSKRKELEHYVTASMGLSSPLSSSSFDKRQKQQPQQHQHQHKKEQPWNIPQLSALGVAVAAGVMVAEQHMSDASQVLTHQVKNFVDGIM